MNLVSYLSHLLLSMLMSLLFVFLFYLKTGSVVILDLFFSFIFALFYVHFIAVKLPIINRYYIRNNKKYVLIISPRIRQDIQQEKAGSVLIGLITACTLAFILYLIGRSSVMESCFITGITACFISGAYVPKG